MTQRERATWWGRHSEFIKSGTAATFAFLSAMAFIIGILMIILGVLGLIWRGVGGLIGAWAPIIGMLFASMLLGWCLFYVIRGIAALRGTARWYWKEKTPPFDDESIALEEYLSIPTSKSWKMEDNGPVWEEFKINMLYGLGIYLLGLLTSLVIAVNQRNFEAVLEDDSSLTALVTALAYLFQIPLELIDVLELPVPQGPGNAAVFVLTMGVPALFFTVACANLSELLERRYYYAYSQIIARKRGEVEDSTQLLICGAIIGWIFILVFIFG